MRFRRIRHLADDVPKLTAHLGNPAPLVWSLRCATVASMRAESVSAFFSGNGVGSNQFHLLFEAFFLGNHQLCIGLRLLEYVVAFL